MADAVSALPFATEFQVKPRSDGSYSWMGIAAYSPVLILKKTWNSCE